MGDGTLVGVNVGEGNGVGVEVGKGTSVGVDIGTGVGVMVGAGVRTGVVVQVGTNSASGCVPVDCVALQPTSNTATNKPKPSAVQTPARRCFLVVLFE